MFNPTSEFQVTIRVQETVSSIIYANIEYNLPGRSGTTCPQNLDDVSAWLTRNLPDNYEGWFIIRTGETPADTILTHCAAWYRSVGRARQTPQLNRDLRMSKV
jgi:hypothetical protein